MFRTGDFGSIVNNQLYYEGRLDSQIKVRGHRVNLNEVKFLVDNLEGVFRSVVVCFKERKPEQVDYD